MIDLKFFKSQLWLIGLQKQQEDVIHAVAARAIAAESELETLRAKLAEIEAQKPVAHAVYQGVLSGVHVRMMHGSPKDFSGYLYVKPFTAQQVQPSPAVAVPDLLNKVRDLRRYENGTGDDTIKLDDVVELLAPLKLMVEMMDSYDEHGAGSVWYIAAKEAIAKASASNTGINKMDKLILQPEFHPNPDICSIHTNKFFVTYYGFSGDPVPEPLKEMVNMLNNIEGVSEVGTNKYCIKITKGRVFRFEELLPTIYEALSKFFNSEIELKEAIDSAQPNFDIVGVQQVRMFPRNAWEWPSTDSGVKHE